MIAGIAPLLAGQIEFTEAFELGSAPIHEFMRANVREQDLGLFFDLTNAPIPDAPEAIPLHLLIPAFMISELRRAFEIGFLLFLPFVVIDMVVASVLMSMGMMMLPPVVISLPFKLIFFVLVDGWYPGGGIAGAQFFERLISRARPAPRWVRTPCWAPEPPPRHRSRGRRRGRR